MLDFGDIVGGALQGGVISHASLASDGAAATYGGAGAATQWRAPCNLTITGAWWVPTGADQSASQSASYRQLSLIAGGSAAAGTTVIASLAMSASLASNASRDMTLVGNATASISTPTISKGDVIYASQATAGGDHSNGTVLRAGHFGFSYRPI